MGAKRLRETLQGFADVGSHGGIFAFDCGPVADRYPGLLQIYTRKVTNDLVPVRIVPESAYQRTRWKPISEIHEDYGPCVLMNVADPGYLEIGSNLDKEWDETLWTHFVPVPSLTQADLADLVEQDALLVDGDCGGAE